ncbi:LrgB family protein [Pollutimonas bauzanensis]|uniref:Putative effector of murein hydrolase n=1 Tax=Pollutimonas bauzanensis TaxID=658167 RepID=A0A1M5Z8K1_9BURK|nr:LrgB family protein [Pollutimonas bauzanensis]SHI20546.1 Putative effector of murein hydrolase [Pollutimonas bauzanensis]
MMAALHALWTPLAVSPLLWLTLACFVFGRMAQRHCGGSPLVNPVLLAIIMMALLLEATDTSYASYFSGAQFINFLLGPATVALAVPLAMNIGHVRSGLREVGLALLAGSLTSTVSGALLVWMFGGARDVAMSMASKSATTPIAIAIAQEVGGVPALTAALAIAGGIVAASVGQTVLGWLRITDWRAHGFAAGVAGSGVAAAQVAPLNGLAAAFAAIGIGLNGLLTALIVPLLAGLWR